MRIDSAIANLFLCSVTLRAQVQPSCSLPHPGRNGCF
jgi:hypothetical protein